MRPLSYSTVQVSGEHDYPLNIGFDLIHQPDLLSNYIVGKQACIVCAQSLSELYLPILNKTLLATNKIEQLDILVLPDNDSNKTIDAASSIWNFLAKRNHHRDTLLIALGGGVMNDLVGFAAACYLRGVSWISLPTTLLAQVDAAIGGKTAVNISLGKNLVGAFYSPKAVLSDLSLLNSLTTEDYCAGLAEVIKYGLAFDKKFFDWLELNAEHILNKQRDTILPIVKRSSEIKAQIVNQDFRENKLRMHLNFGHTLGHALETALSYKIKHGCAVSIGMMMACKLSLNYGLDQNSFEKAEALLEKFSLPTRIPNSLVADTLLNIIARDKKHSDTQRWIILTGLGKAEIKEDIPIEIIHQTIESMMTKS